MKTRIAIVGGGITGLATAAWLEHDHQITDVLVFEGGETAGGKLQSEIVDGHTIEWGPQGFLDNAPDTLELISLSGLDDALVRADEASADRFIVRQDRLRLVETSPVAFMLSDVLPLGARLRLLGEPFARSKPPGDETVFDFAARRIGPKAAEILVDAMVTGVFAGDSRRLSLAATFPKMAAMEAEYGSLTRALVGKMREARNQGRTSSGPAGPGGTLCTLREGMAQLPRNIASGLGSRLRLGEELEGIECDGGTIVLHGKGSKINAESVLLTTPAHVTASLIERPVPAAAQQLSGIATAPIAVVMASYDDPGAFGVPLRGFGFLVPGNENLGILGTLFCHAIFPGQAPHGKLFLRVMLGGARDPEILSLDDDQLLARVRASLIRVYALDPQPDRVWTVRHERGISQYSVGHLDRVDAIEGALRPIGLDVAGSPFRGVSVNDCIRQARAAAKRLAIRLEEK